MESLNYDNIITFGCSFSKISNENKSGKNYTELLSEKYNIPYLNKSLNGSSNPFNYFQLYESYKNGEIGDNSLILFQFTFKHRICFEIENDIENPHSSYHSINDNNMIILHLSPSRTYNNDSITKFSENYFSHFAGNYYNDVLNLTSTFYFLNYLKEKYKNLNFVTLSWDNIDPKLGVVSDDLNNILEKSKKNKLQNHHIYENNDLHLSEIGHEWISNEIIKTLTKF